MALNFIKHTWQKVALITVAIIVAIILLLALLINIYWSPILASKAKKGVASVTDSLYTVDFADAKLNILQGKITVYDLNFKLDTTVYNRHKREHRAPDNLVNLHVKRLVLSHIHPFTLYFKHILNIDQIVFSTPEINVVNQPVNDTIAVDNRTTWQKINKTLHWVHVGQTLLNDIKFRYDDRSGKKPVVSEFKEMNIKGNDLLIDSTTQKDTSRLLYFKDVVANLYNYKGKTNDGLYTYTAKALMLSTYKSQLNVEGLTLEPTKNFFKKSQGNRYKASIDSLQMNSFDFLAYHKYHRLRASNFIINGGNLDIFANPTKHIDHRNKTSSFPNKAIYNIPFDVKIDTLLINRTNVIYEEFNPRSHKWGTITFNSIHGKFLNITTNKAALQKNNLATVHITSKFMNRGKLSVFFTFNLTDKTLPYSYKGRLGPMDLQAINPAMIPLDMVKVTSGTLKEFTFDIKGNIKKSHGRVALLYNDVKVKLLKADTATGVLKRKTIESLYANVFVIKHDNPDKAGGIPRATNVNFSRPLDFPFFKTAWQTLLAGIKPCVGLSAKVVHATTELKDKKDLEKKNHESKKQMRKERRAERKLKRQEKRAQKAALKAQKEQEK